MLLTRSLPWMLTAVICVPGLTAQQAEQQESAQQLVRETVYNELHDHDAHGYWRYWIRQQRPEGIRVSEQIETHDGPVTRVLLTNGRPLDEQDRQEEQSRLDQLAGSPSEIASHRQAYAEDEKRVGRIMTMLPDAFLFEDLGEENGCRHLRFHPNPDYNAHSIEARFFHALTGDLWIDARMKRMARLEGRMEDDLNFGMGLLGRVNKGSWFRMDRTQVSPTEWKTNRLEIHVSGRAILFKTIARDTSEVRGGFAPVPAGMSLAQGIRALNQSQATDVAGAPFSPAAFTSYRR